MDNRDIIHFNLGAWRNDPGIQGFDYETRGIWFEILCLMDRSERRGVLLLNGGPMPDAHLARVLGLPLDRLRGALGTVVGTGVAAREDGTGALVSLQMIGEEKIRQICREAGKKGGNPALLAKKA